jgi:hypothetical protein
MVKISKRNYYARNIYSKKDLILRRMCWSFAHIREWFCCQTNNISHIGHVCLQPWVHRSGYDQNNLLPPGMDLVLFILHLWDPG